MKKTLLILLVLSITVSLFGCSSGQPGEVPTDGEVSESGKLKIGVAAASYSNSWNITNTDDMVETLKAAGHEVTWNEAKNDTATQISNISDLLARDIDYLIAKPKEERGLAPSIEAARKAGVKIILVDRKIVGTPGEDYETAIMTDNVDGGRLIGQWVVDNFPNGANIVEITGTPGSTGNIERGQGFHEVIDEVANLKVLDSQVGNNARKDAQKAAENLIQAHGDEIDIICTQNDEMSFGILQAIDGMGLVPGKDIVVVSIGDGNKAVLEEIAAGRVAAVYESTPYLGETVLETIEKLENGEEIPGYIPSNNRLFTIENVGEELPKVNW